MRQGIFLVSLVIDRLMCLCPVEPKCSPPPSPSLLPSVFSPSLPTTIISLFPLPFLSVFSLISCSHPYFQPFSSLFSSLFPSSTTWSYLRSLPISAPHLSLLSHPHPHHSLIQPYSSHSLSTPPPHLPHPTSPLIPSPAHQDHDKAQDEVLKHQASISQLKRSFMEAPPPSPPQLNQWEKRLTSSPATTIRVQQQQVVCPPECSCLGNLSYTASFLPRLFQVKWYFAVIHNLFWQWKVS